MFKFTAQWQFMHGNIMNHGGVSVLLQLRPQPRKFQENAASLHDLWTEEAAAALPFPSQSPAKLSLQQQQQ